MPKQTEQEIDRLGGAARVDVARHESESELDEDRADWRRASGHALRGISTSLDLACRGILVVAILGSCLLTFCSVVQRATTGSSIVWANDATAVLMTVAAFIGCVTVFHHGDHVGLYALSSRYIHGRARVELDAGLNVLIGIFAAVVARSGWDLSTAAGLGTFGSQQWPVHVLYIPLFVGMSLVALLSFLRLVANISSQRVWLGPLAVGALAVVLHSLVVPIQNLLAGHVVALTGVVIVIVLLVGMPVAFAIGMGTMVGVMFSPTAPSLNQIPLQMTNLVTNITLISLPFFVLAGAILGRGAVAKDLLSLFRRVTRNMPGGEGVAAVLSMYIFSGLSGSKFADIAAIAPGLARETQDAEEGKEGPLEEITGVITASAVMGETVPPSIMLLALGSVTTISTGALFLAGLAPAALLGLAVIVLVLFRGSKFYQARIDYRSSWIRLIVGSVPVVVGILIIVGGIIGGFATPSEASSLATIYSVLIIVLLYRVSWREVLTGIEVAARLAGMLLFLISITGALAWFFTISGLAEDMADVFTVAGSNKWMFMLISVGLLIVLGTVFEGLPAILVFAPILVPIAVDMGINPIQYGIVLLMSLGIGTFLPPFGIGYYATCAIIGASPDRSIRRTFLYLVPITVGVLVVALFPGISTFL